METPLAAFAERDTTVNFIARNSADSTLVDSLANVLLDELKRLKAPLADFYNPGAQDKDIENAERQLGFRLPADAVALFKWRNGIIHTDTIPMGSLWLFPLGTPVSLKTALKTHKYYARNSSYRKRKLLLVFDNYGGEMFFLDCNEQSKTFGQIWAYNLTALEDGDPAMSVRYDSLAALFKTLIRCYREGIYTFSVSNSRKILRSDFKREVNIAKEMNPDTDHWKELSEAIKTWPADK